MIPRPHDDTVCLGFCFAATSFAACNCASVTTIESLTFRRLSLNSGVGPYCLSSSRDFCLATRVVLQRYTLQQCTSVVKIAATLATITRRVHFAFSLARQDRATRAQLAPRPQDQSNPDLLPALLCHWDRRASRPWLARCPRACE